MRTCSCLLRRRRGSRGRRWCIMEISDSFSSRTSGFASHLFVCVKQGRDDQGELKVRHGVIKVCDEFPGFTRFKQHQPFGAPAPRRISVPRSHAKHPTDTYPHQSQRSIERAVKTFLPQFADRPLFNKAMCWCTDTADAALLICEHPRWRNLVLATGDSGYVLFHVSHTEG